MLREAGQVLINAENCLPEQTTTTSDAATPQSEVQEVCIAN